MNEPRKSGLQLYINPRIKLLVRRGEKLECLWELSQEASDALLTNNPPDLHQLMHQAVLLSAGNDMLVDALFLSNRSGRYWMDVHGMRKSEAIVTRIDLDNIAYDHFEGIRLAIDDDLT